MKRLIDYKQHKLMVTPRVDKDGVLTANLITPSVEVDFTELNVEEEAVQGRIDEWRNQVDLVEANKVRLREFVKTLR